MRFAGFIGPSYVARSKNFDCQRTINWYPELNELGTGREREVACLAQVPGKKLLLDIGTVYKNRGSIETADGKFYVVNGNKLYFIDSTWTKTELGTLQTTAGQISMADNGVQLVVVDGDYGYVYTYATDADPAVFAQITDPDFPGATQVVFQDGYFIFTKPNSQQFFICDLYDATTFDALDFASSEGAPDNIIGQVSDHRDLWMFNRNTVEIFYNSGDADFPFVRNQGAFIETGCAAAGSIQKMNNTVYWVGRDKDGPNMVYQAQGYQPKPISTTAINLAIAAYGDISDTTSWTYQMNGHFFYALNFTNAKTTWVFDATTNMWHERVKTVEGIFERDRVLCHSYVYSKHVVCGREDGKIYELTDDVNTDGAGVLTRRRISPHISQDMAMNFHAEFQLDVETGVGLDGVGQGTDPQVMLRYSKDYGKSWSNERMASLGKIGERLKRVIWRSLGASRDRVYEITVTDPVRATLMGAQLRIQQGKS